MATKRGYHLDIEDFIHQNYVNLTNKLEVKSVIPYLMQPEILLRSDKERILAKVTREDQAGELLDILTHNGKCTVDVFIHALEETKQTRLLDLLGSQYRKKRAVESDGSSSLRADFNETAANPGHADDERDGAPSDPIATDAPRENFMARPPGVHVEERSPEAQAGSSNRLEGRTKPRILLVNDEYGTAHGGISTINCQVGQMTANDEQADVSCTVLHAPNEDQRDADKHGVKLIKPRTGAGPRNSRDPSKDWLYYHQEHYPHLPNDVDCVIGHADITDQAARKIKNDRYPQAKLVTINHVIREDTEAYKGGRRPMEAWKKEMDALKEVEDADVVFSVGKRMYNHYSTVYKGDKGPKSHQIFLPKPSDIFVNTKVEAGSCDGQMVVLSIGRVMEAEKLKGHDLAAGSLGIVGETIKDAAWRVCGINKDNFDASKKILEDNLKSGNLKPTLVPYGTQEEICENMKKAHLVLMPSRSEPFGLVGLEAIAAGIPVLISDKSGLADLIKDLIKKKKCHPDRRHRIVKTSVNESNLDADAKVWAVKILDTLENIEAEFEKAAEFKRELLASKYWEESHQAFLRACGITAAHQ
ncbi:uncharacterized protein LOC144887634 [Branchiostoma floridae x Branchiostoma japonicum]